MFKTSFTSRRYGIIIRLRTVVRLITGVRSNRGGGPFTTPHRKDR